MLRWPSSQGVMGDDPPYLSVGTEVSAKYKGAFCEAKVRKVVRSVKCKVTFKTGLGTTIVTDDQIRGTLRVGSVVEVKHSDKKEYVEATIAKIQDCSQYTVVFDDGDITTLRRTALCLKSGRHFAESETLDQLPLTHPEHFGNPVVGSRRGGRRSRNAGSDESSDEEDIPHKGKVKEEKEADIGKVVCVELGDKKKQKDNWFPGLVVAPTAQEVVRIRVKDEYLVRSFKDGRYFTVPKKEATEFTREIGSKVDNNTLKTAVDKALLYLDKDELPPHWDRDLLFGLEDTSSNSDSDAAFDSDSSDDEPREEKDHFVAQLYKFMDDRSTPINRGPQVSGRDIDLYKLFKVVHKLGGYNRVTNHNQWKVVSHKLGFGQVSNTANLVKVSYKKFLHSFEDFYRKLGCTMVNHPRGNRTRHRGGRSLIRDRDRATPVNTPQGDSKDKGSDNAEGEDGDQSDRRDEVTEEGPEDREEQDEDAAKRRELKIRAKDDVILEMKKTLDISAAEREVAVVDDRDDRARSRDRPPRKDDKLVATSSGKDIESSKASPGPPPLERKPSDPQLKIITPKGKTSKKLLDGSSAKSTQDAKKRVIVHKLKGARLVGEDYEVDEDEDEEVEDDDEMDELDVEELEEDEDKLANTRSKSKDEFTRLKKEVVEIKTSSEADKKIKPVEGSDKKVKPTLTAEKRTVRPSLTASSEKKTKSSSQDNERKTVRSLAAEFEKKARAPGDSEKKDRSNSDVDKKARPVTLDSEKKVRPTLTATLEKKKLSSVDVDKKSKPNLGSDSEKKVRPSLTADPERKKVRPSLTADPTKKPSRGDSERRKEGDRKGARPDHDKEEGERKTKIQDGDRKVNTPDSSRLSSADSSKSSKSDSGDSEKKGSGKVKKGDDEKRKLHIRKRKESDDVAGGLADENLDQLPSYKSVSVGDRLKVYYGPTHESKVTYEAKVLEVEGEGPEAAFLVHYTGWNNRYDEWIKRFRIADNLSWSPARAKRRHQAQLTGAKKTLAKRRTLTPGRDGSQTHQKDHQPSMPSLPGSEKSRDSQPPRSSTPSSVTSSSSRTKSPATRPGSARITRNTTGEANALSSELSSRRARTRRISGQTDIVSESESEPYESESEAEPSSTRKSNRLNATEKDDDGLKKDSSFKKRVRKLPQEVGAEEEDEKDEEKDDDKDDAKDEDVDVSNESPGEEKVSLKRTRKGTRLLTDRKLDIKVEVDEDAPPGQTAKGRDFDLNQIRSELKGFDKAVKVPVDPSSVKIESVDISEEKVTSPVEVDEPILDMEDVYEFKEPEPFEFEVRSKREPSVERTGKLQKRPLPRIFDDVDKTDKNPVKKKIVKPKIGESESSEEGSPAKKRFRRTIGKKDDGEAKIDLPSEAPELTPEKVLVLDQTTPQKKIFSTSDDAFDKLRHSPSYRFSSSPIRVRTPTPTSPSAQSPVHSPPQSSSASVINTPPTLTLPVSRNPQINHVTKPVPLKMSSVSASKVTSLQISSAKPSPAKISPPPKLIQSAVRSVVQSVVPPVVPSVVQSAASTLASSRPPTLAASVKLSSDASIAPPLCGPRSEDWSESSDKEEHAVLIPKIEVEECLPPLVSPPHSISISDRTSPEPPQLLPMFGPPSKAFHDPNKQEARDVPMPQIKKENITEICSDARPVIHSYLIRPEVSSGVPTLENDTSEDIPHEEVLEIPPPEISSFHAAPSKVSLTEVSPPEDFSPEFYPDVSTSQVPFSRESLKVSDSEEGNFKISPVQDSPVRPATPEHEHCTIKVEVSSPRAFPAEETAPEEKLPHVQSQDAAHSAHYPTSAHSDALFLDAVRRDSASMDDIVPPKAPVHSSGIIIRPSPPGKKHQQDSIRRAPHRKVNIRKRKTLSREFVYDSDSDSSDEGRPLVIDKSESSDSCTESFDGRLHSSEVVVTDTRKQTGLKKLEAPIESNRSCPIKKEDIRSFVIKEDAPQKPRDSVLNVVNSVIVEKPSLAEDIVKVEEPEEVEGDSNLCSLLCEETIPGSPAPVSDTPADATIESDVPNSVQHPQDSGKTPAAKMMEMPFASVPGNTRTPDPSTTSTGTLQHSKTAVVHHGDNMGVKIELGHSKAGSSASAAGSMKRDGNEAAPVMDNTPPTTPDSSISTISNSPRGERDGSSPPLDNDSTKSHRDSEDTDHKEGHYSDDDIDVTQGIKRSVTNKKGNQENDLERDRGDAEPMTSPLPKKRRRSRKASECEDRPKRPRQAPTRAQVRGGPGSDSDDNTENTAPSNVPQTPQITVSAVHSQTQSARSPRPSKYNFHVELAPELDASQRIALLQQKLQELRKTYASVKAQLACIDRRRKKLRRREREAYQAARKLLREARKQAQEQQILCS